MSAPPLHTPRKAAHGKPCPYCTRKMDERDFRLRPTRDHFVPRSRGGTKKIICCNQCNGIKGDMMPNQWQAYMQANPRWWTLTKAERRARAKAARRLAGVPNVHGNFIKPRNRQGSPPAAPVVVPPALIYADKSESRLTAQQKTPGSHVINGQIIRPPVYDFDIWPPSKLL